MKKIPLIIPNFNQLFYLKNLINWWRWYYPENPIFVVDNNSDYLPLQIFYNANEYGFETFYFSENNCAANLSEFIETDIKGRYEYYVISDPDIMPHPNTPPNFLEILKAVIDSGFHRAGFGLITSDLPEELHERAFVIGNEKELLSVPVEFNFEDKIYNGFRAPIDTTFCLYKSSNGWAAPMSGENWGNCLRLFQAFHLGWYIRPDCVNPEMDNYFKTSKYRDGSPISAGKNNNRPKQYV